MCVIQIYAYHLRSILHILILTYNNVTLTEKKKGLLSLFILERLFRLLLYVYIFSLLFFYFFFLKMDLILKKVCLIVLETNNTTLLSGSTRLHIQCY